MKPLTLLLALSLPAGLAEVDRPPSSAADVRVAQFVAGETRWVDEADLFACDPALRAAAAQMID